MGERKTLSAPLDRLEDHARHDDVLEDVALVLREISLSLIEIKEQVAGRTKEIFTIEEFAGLTGRAPYTIRDWVRKKKIRAQRIEGTGPKGRLLIPRSELEKIICSGKGQNLVGMALKPPQRTCLETTQPDELAGDRQVRRDDK